MTTSMTQLLLLLPVVGLPPPPTLLTLVLMPHQVSQQKQQRRFPRGEGGTIGATVAAARPLSMARSSPLPLPRPLLPLILSQLPVRAPPKSQDHQRAWHQQQPHHHLHHHHHQQQQQYHQLGRQQRRRWRCSSVRGWVVEEKAVQRDRSWGKVKERVRQVCRRGMRGLVRLTLSVGGYIACLRMYCRGSSGSHFERRCSSSGSGSSIIIIIIIIIISSSSSSSNSRRRRSSTSRQQIF